VLAAHAAIFSQATFNTNGISG